MLRPGTHLGPYEITGLLGAGGMGEVYRARDTRLGRDVAIKVLPAEFAGDPDRLRRFEQEARAVAALNHPNIVAIHDIGTYEGSPYIVSELLEGESLRQRLAVAPLPVRKAIELAVQIAQGLAAAHEKGIVHRDLKPENLFITKDGQAKILDFGVAKLATKLEPVEGAAPTVVGGTDPGIVMGTAGYMSPEQVRGLPVDHRSDIFSLGCVLYEMVQGRLAFPGDTTVDTIAAILTRDPEPLSGIDREIPSVLSGIVGRCLEKSPEDRFSSAHDVALALALVAGTERSVVAAPVAAAARVLPRSRRSVWVAASIGVLGLVALAALAYLVIARRAPPASRAPGKLMLAVLPMENLSGDPQQEYFSDGLTEEMIARLGRLEPKRLGVIARTSAMHYKRTTKTIDEIGRELGVQYVLEGSVRREAGRVRVTAQLIQVKDQTHLWAESFERELSGVFLVQAEVAERVAGSLAIELLPERRTILDRGSTTSREAHDAYLRGLFLWNTRQKANLEQAVVLFRRAIDLDQEYAPAYVGLADTYLILYDNGYAAAAETMPPTEVAIRKALELDDASAEAHATLAIFYEDYRWDRPESEREFRRALELNAGCAKAHQWYALLLSGLGRHDEALGHIREAVRLDPASPRMNVNVGWILLVAHRYDEARLILEDVVRLFPADPYSQMVLGRVLHMQGRRTEAAGRYQRASELSSGSVSALNRAAALFIGGNARDARGLIEGMERGEGPEYVSPADVASLKCLLGDFDAALRCLERAFSTRDGRLGTVKDDPIFDPLRSDPRFQDLLRRMNFPSR